MLKSHNQRINPGLSPNLKATAFTTHSTIPRLSKAKNSSFMEIKS
jgi:hypothetical protein